MKPAACYGKTELRPRQRITRPLRQRHGLATRNSANRERPPQDWIEIAVAALIGEETFALAQEQLEQNRRSNQVFAAGRDTRRFPCPAAGAGGRAGRARASEGLAPAWEGDPGGPGDHRHPTLDLDRSACADTKQVSRFLVFGAQSPSPPVPLSTLHLPSRGDRRKTRGQDGVASPFL